MLNNANTLTIKFPNKIREQDYADIIAALVTKIAKEAHREHVQELPISGLMAKVKIGKTIIVEIGEK